MKSFISIISLAFAALVSAQAAPPQGAQGEPCPPQFKLQCCAHVISAADASKFNIQVDAKAFPGLAGTSCKYISLSLQSLPVTSCFVYTSGRNDTRQIIQRTPMM
jgi:hypothetical protein